MRLIILSFFIALSFSSHAQSKSPGEITANGIARSKIKPDIAVITITVEKAYPDESTVLKDLNKEVDKLSQLLFKIGFTGKQIKISRYSVTNNLDQDKIYRATNTLIVQFVLDNKVIDKVYSSIETEKFNNVSLELETKLSDSLEKATRSGLLVKALQEAQTSANNIATALGVKLGKVKHVSKYGDVFTSVNKVEYARFTWPKGLLFDAAGNTSFKDFDVQEIEIEEQITIIYEIL
jgi:uncharacterized protein